jgi:hypothetical protein
MIPKDPTLTPEFIKTLRETLGSIEVESAAKSLLANRRLLDVPFPPIPVGLVGVVDVILPGDGRDNDTTVVVKLTPLVASEFGHVCRPSFGTVDVVNMSLDNLGEYNNYAHAWAEYVRDMLTIVESQMSDLRRQRLWASSQIDIALTEAGYKKTERSPRVNTHAVISELDSGLALHEQLKLKLDSALKSVQEIMNLGSREITRRSFNPENSRSKNGDDYNRRLLDAFARGKRA